LVLRFIIHAGLLGLAVAACSNNVEVQNPISQPPLVKPVNRTVGIFYSPHLRIYSCIVDKGYIAAAWTIQVGAPSIAMFNKILRSKFQNVEQLRENPLTGSVPAGKESFLFELVSFDGCEASWPIIGTTRMSIAYRSRLLRADGSTVEDFTARGHAGPADAEPGLEGRHLTSLTEAAMRKAAADFIVQIEESEKIDQWLEGAN
jgi:hypothetical protein